MRVAFSALVLTMAFSGSVMTPKTVSAQTDSAPEIGQSADTNTSQADGSQADGSQADGSQSLADALALIQNQEFAQAIEILEALAAKSPRESQIQRALGQAYFGAMSWPEAVTANLRAATDPAQRDGAWWDASRALAKQQRHEEAIHLLEQIARRGQTDLSNIRLLPAFAEIKDEPRVRALLPDADAISDPFVEGVRVLREWRGEAAGDSFGWIARRLGDVDGDGVFDVVTSAVGHDTGGNNAGRVYVYSGKSGKLLWTRDGEEGWLLGRGVESAGDVDGDGVEDVVASAPGGDRAFVYSGKDGQTLLELEASQESESFGQHIDGAGDLDGDGHGDVLVGSPQNHTAGQAAGRIAVYSGKSGKILMEVHGREAGARLGETVAGGQVGGRPVLMAGAPGAGESYVYDGRSKKLLWTFKAEISHSGFGGMFMSVPGDIDQDGVEDFYISDWADGVKGAQTGRIYLFSGKDGRRLFTLTGEQAGDGFGIGIADAGDINGDGHADLAVGAWQFSGAAPGGGKIYVISGRDGTTQRTVTAKTMGETFGFDATHIGDLDGDGVFDLLLTSAWSPLADGARTGRIFVLAGEPFD